MVKIISVVIYELCKEYGKATNYIRNTQVISNKFQKSKISQLDSMNNSLLPISDFTLSYKMYLPRNALDSSTSHDTVALKTSSRSIFKE